MKDLKLADLNGKRYILRFIPAHTSALGTFSDSWQIITAPLPINGKGVKIQTFRSFISATMRFNKLTAVAA